jgi:hypothetical protein
MRYQSCPTLEVGAGGIGGKAVASKDKITHTLERPSNRAVQHLIIY